MVFHHSYISNSKAAEVSSAIYHFRFTEVLNWSEGITKTHIYLRSSCKIIKNSGCGVQFFFAKKSYPKKMIHKPGIQRKSYEPRILSQISSITFYPRYIRTTSINSYLYCKKRDSFVIISRTVELLNVYSLHRPSKARRILSLSC